jgi:hypothetical protein
MTIRKPFGIGLALGLIALAFAAMPALASAGTFTDSEGEPLGEGEPLQASSSNLTFVNSNGIALLCADDTLSASVGSTPDDAFIESATFTGAGGEPCATNISGVFADFTVAAGWTFQLTESEDVWHLKEHIVFTMTTTNSAHESFAHCTYTRATSVTGTYTTANPTTLTIGAGQTFVAAEGSSPFCGTATVLTGEFSLSSTGGSVGIS